MEWAEEDGLCGKFLVFLLGLTCLLQGCVAPHKYKPTVISTPAQQSEPSNSNTIPLAVRVVKLVDVSPADDKEDGWLYSSGWSVTSPERLNGDLTGLLTEAIAVDLRSNGVFKNVVQDDQREHLRLEGKIHRFYQRREHYLWALCCGLLGALLPFPLMKEEGEVDIELTLSYPNGSLIKSYRGKSRFLKRCNFYESRCMESYNSSPAKYLDEAFGEFMYQIRQGLILDKALIAQRISMQK